MPSSFSILHEARADIENILDYTAANFGFKQAEIYYASLQNAFSTIQANPAIGRPADDVAKKFTTLCS